MKFYFHKPKRISLAVFILIMLVAGLQFVARPVRNPPVTHPIKAPAAVVSILQRACYDCHSNETKLRWYDRVAPLSWWVSSEVREARSRFNFSTWDTLAPADQQGRLWEMVNMILDGKMPLKAYAAMHPQARLSAGDIAVLKAYVLQLSPARYHDTAIVSQAGKEFAEYAPQVTSAGALPVAANGVAYIPGYRNWQVISTTNRFDNHSIRVVYGNDIVVKAIREQRINPLPEGSTIVKVVWNSIEEKNGDIIPGSVNSVQIMTKDRLRFPDSKGWGFAKFNGTTLKPFGKTALFHTACFNCHKAASANDYVFNLPLPADKLP